MLGMFKAMRTTLSHLPRKTVTEQYPEERYSLPERSRGLFSVVINPATDDPRCRSCTLCETNCPVQVIRVNYRSKYPVPAVNEARIAAARVAVQPSYDGKLVQKIVAEHYLQDGVGMVHVLQEMQEAFGFLPRLALRQVSVGTGISLSEIYGLASFYPQFRLAPVGKFVINVCTGTACRVAGASQVIDAFSEELGVGLDETTADGLFTLQTANCLGACALAPVVRVGETDTLGRLNADAARELVRTLRAGEEA
jgi:NADH:ubiquinone oxidoreductase subunit E/NAD-dependent dihydropyrimidine dehydrogenase PreA subunit